MQSEVGCYIRYAPALAGLIVQMRNDYNMKVVLLHIETPILFLNSVFIILRCIFDFSLAYQRKN